MSSGLNRTPEWHAEYKRKRGIPTLTDAASGPGAKITDSSIPTVTGQYPPKPDLFISLCKQEGLPKPEAEFYFKSGRRWRFDYAFPRWKVAIEIEGGVWIQGRHTRGKGFLNDMEKYNEATRLGWRVFRYTPDQISKAVSDLKAL